MSLENYFNKLIKLGYLKKEKIGLEQIKALLLSAHKNLEASQKTFKIDEETCYAMAYTVMIKVARAVIYIKGYRPDDGQQHKTTVEAAGEILGSDFKELIVKFDKMRRQRNQFTYEPIMPVSRSEAAGAFKTAVEFYQKVKIHLEKIDPQKKLFYF